MDSWPSVILSCDWQSQQEPKIESKPEEIEAVFAQKLR